MTEITDSFLNSIHSNYVELIDEPVYLPFGVKHTTVEVTEFGGTEDESPFASVHLRFYSPLYARESAMELFDMDHGDNLETATAIQRSKSICFADMGLIVYLDDIEISPDRMITACRQVLPVGFLSQPRTNAKGGVLYVGL